MPEAIDVDAEYEQIPQQQQQQQQQQQHPLQANPHRAGFPAYGAQSADKLVGYHTVNATGGAINYSDALQKAAIYVNRIKTHFQDAPDAFRQFLELLRLHKTNMIAVQDVYNDVSNLLSGSQELLNEFSMFLPEVIRCSINSQLGEIRADNVEAWVSEAAPAFPICVIFVAPKGPLMYPADFHDLVAHMRGCIAFAILDVNLQAAVGHAMLNNARRDMRAEPPSLPVWKLYHKGMHCAEAVGWPTGFSLQGLLHTHSKQYGWKAITAANGQQPALQPGRTVASHSSAFRPAASSGGRPGGAFSAVGTGKMSLNNVLSGGDAPPLAPGGGGIGDGGRAPGAADQNGAAAPSATGGAEMQHETAEERKARRRKEKKKKRKREKKEKRREEKRARKEAAVARTAAYKAEEAAARGDTAAAAASAPGAAASADTEGADEQQPGTEQHALGAAAAAARSDESDSDADEDEKQEPAPDTSHIVQSKNSRGRPQRSAAVAAEAISAATNAKTDRDARREDRERREREKANEPVVERKPDAKSLRLAAKALYFSPGQEYFHCRTGAVIRKDEASLVDSDDDVDTTWIQKQNEDLMEEFTDVSSDEKTFMKLWNDFMQGFGAYSDYYVSPKCVEFTQGRLKPLVEHKLRQCLLFHLFSLWDLGLVEKECVDECVELYDLYEAENGESGGSAKAATASSTEGKKASEAAEAKEGAS